MLRQPRRIEPRKGSSVLGSHARLQSVLSAASDAADPIGCPEQNDGPARSPALRQKHEGVESGAIAHRYRGLKSASAAGSIGELHRCAPVTKEPVLAPAL